MSIKSQQIQSILIIILFNLFVVCADVWAIQEPAVDLQSAGIYTVLGTQLDLNIKLQNSEGNIISLASILADGKPLILVPAYYRCPRLCGLVSGGVAQLVKDLDLKLGADYKIATFSFNPREIVEEARSKRDHYSGVLAESNKSIDGWDFYIGKSEDTALLTKQLGFGLVADGEEYAHSAAIFIINPAAQLSQYFSNIEYDSRDVRLALVEAAQGKIGNILDHVMLFCFRFDSDKGQYTWAVARLLKVVGGLSIVFIVGLIGYQLFREKKANKNS